MLESALFFKTYIVQCKVRGRWKRVFFSSVHTDTTKLRFIIPKTEELPDISGLNKDRMIKFFASANNIVAKEPGGSFFISQEFGNFRLIHSSRPNISFILSLFIKRKRISFKAQELLCE